MTGDVLCDELARLLIWDLPETYHPQQLSVFPECGNPVVMNSPLRRSSLSWPLQNLVNGTLCDALNPSNIILSAPFTKEIAMSCNISPEIWRGIVYLGKNPDQKSLFNQWDSSESNLIRTFSWPATLPFNEYAHSKLHEMYSQGLFLLKSIQPTSRNWDHIFRNKLQSMQSISQSVKFESFSEDKMFKQIGRQWHSGQAHRCAYLQLRITS